MSYEIAGLYDAARAALSQVVGEDGRKESLNETETRTHLIDPVLQALGYRTLDSIRREVRLSASGQVVDYVLTAGAQRVVVEAKAADLELSARDGGQLVGYSAQEGIRWALLSNGYVWQVFDIEAQGNWESKKVAEINLARAFREGTLAESLTPLAHFAWETLKVDDSALRAFVYEERVRSTLDSLLGNAQSEVIGAIVQAMARTGLTVEPDDVVSYLRKSIVGPTPPVRPVERPAPQTPTTEAAFYVFPIAPEGGYSAEEHLSRWLAAGCWGVRGSTPHRTRIKAGDRCCFYATGVGIVACARVSGSAMSQVSPSDWPGPSRHETNIYRVSLTEIQWLPKAVQITFELRKELDAFTGRDLSRPWSWFIQSTNRLTEHDYQRLTAASS